MSDQHTHPQAFCVNCGKKPSEIPYYVEYAEDASSDPQQPPLPDELVWNGAVETLNLTTGMFICVPCTEVMDVHPSEINPLWTVPQALCVGCDKQPGQLSEYISMAEELSTEDTVFSPEYVVWREEGTLNRVNGHFLCTDCYITEGMPTAPGGWVAP